ncbi:MAG: hypothetical protein QXF41_01070 [Candidatus Micrarchaeaceae archaeon]
MRFLDGLEEKGAENQSLFNLRREERLYMSESAFDKFIGRLGITENKEQSAYIQSIYFDTTDQAMPLGWAVRTRSYLKEQPESVVINDERYIVDEGYIRFNTKEKHRYSASIKEIENLLNRSVTLRAGGFRPYVATIYKRRVFELQDVRITFDSDIRLFSIGADMSVKRLNTPTNSELEIKYLDGGRFDVAEMAKGFGAVHAVSKHYLAYNMKYIEEKDRALSAVNYMETPGKEVELKFDIKDDTVFRKFIVKIATGSIPNFKLWEVFPEPATMESYNEYRVVPGENKVARVMYFGGRKPRIVAKDRGTFTENGILVRAEDKDAMTEGQISALLNSDIVSVSRRIKRENLVLSESTGKIYNVSVDLSQTPRGRELYQLEIEYWRSLRKSSADPMPEILEEINTLGEYAEKEGAVKSVLRKEDWTKEDYATASHQIAKAK